jgi:hypothetical protein
VHVLLELAVWLQAGEDRAIAAGSQTDAKTGCLPLLVVLDSSTFTTLYSIRCSAILSS